MRPLQSARSQVREEAIAVRHFMRGNDRASSRASSGTILFRQSIRAQGMDFVRRQRLRRVRRMAAAPAASLRMASRRPCVRRKPGLSLHHMESEWIALAGRLAIGRAA